MHQWQGNNYCEALQCCSFGSAAHGLMNMDTLVGFIELEMVTSTFAPVTSSPLQLYSLILALDCWYS
jgi:hypothetical protein